MKTALIILQVLFFTQLGHAQLGIGFHVDQWGERDQRALFNAGRGISLSYEFGMNDRFVVPFLFGITKYPGAFETLEINGSSLDTWNSVDPSTPETRIISDYNIAGYFTNASMNYIIREHERYRMDFGIGLTASQYQESGSFTQNVGNRYFNFKSHSHFGGYLTANAYYSLIPRLAVMASVQQSLGINFVLADIKPISSLLFRIGLRINFNEME